MPRLLDDCRVGRAVLRDRGEVDSVRAEAAGRTFMNAAMCAISSRQAGKKSSALAVRANTGGVSGRLRAIRC